MDGDSEVGMDGFHGPGGLPGGGASLVLDPAVGAILVLW